MKFLMQFNFIYYQNILKINIFTSISGSEINNDHIFPCKRILLKVNTLITQIIRKVAQVLLSIPPEDSLIYHYLCHFSFYSLGSFLIRKLS
jgi:hypothetical protein